MDRLSLIHFFSSTRIRCMTAIWPAGPPKERSATRSQTRVASAKEMPCAATVSVISRLRLVGRPVVRFVRGVAAPAIEGVVERHTCLELREIVRMHSRESKRGREQASRFRYQIEARRIRRAHDLGEMQECLCADAEFLDHDVEGAALAAMAPEHAINIV